MERLQIGDSAGWHFENGAWVDTDGGGIGIPQEIRRQSGDSLQGHHYAFHLGADYGDFRARLRFSLTPHSDAGLIFHAVAPDDFFVLHFPECGQADRAQHFWAAVSRMSGEGWLRIVRMELVRRVSSTTVASHEADIQLAGNRLFVRIDERGVFDVTDPSFVGYGRVGLFLFNNASIVDASVGGAKKSARVWPADKSPRTTWFHPVNGMEPGTWQRPGQIVRAGDDLLLSFTTQKPAYSGTTAEFVTRSTDNGRTWSPPERVTTHEAEAWDGWGYLHRWPDGVLRMLISSETGARMAEGGPYGKLWRAPKPIPMPAAPSGLKRVYPAPLLNLSDGSVLAFGYGGHDSTIPGSSIFTWGSCHCQAFAARTTDNGATWSNWVNIDGTRDSTGKTVDGSLDLTEICGAEVAPGRIVALIRPVYSPWMWETWSEDGGRTWTPCVRGPFPGYATSNMLRTTSGVLLVAHRLPGSTIHASHDDGVSWDTGTQIDSAIWVMGSMIEVEPDRVLYVYWDSFESSMRAQFIRVTPRGIFPDAR